MVTQQRLHHVKIDSADVLVLEVDFLARAKSLAPLKETKLLRKYLRLICLVKQLCLQVIIYAKKCVAIN